MDEPPREPSQPIARWELELIGKVVKRFRTSERDDLQAELARKLLALTVEPPSQVRNWRAYVAKFLLNKAANWVRDERARQHRHGPIENAETAGVPSAPLAAENWGSPEPDAHLSVAFARLWDELDPALKRLWQVLAEERGNQVRAARRLGKHRNTVRHSIRKIRAIARRHGFEPSI